MRSRTRAKQEGISFHAKIYRNLRTSEKTGFKCIDEFIEIKKWRCEASEKKVTRGGVSGRVDAIYRDCNEKLILIDWKNTSRRLKLNYSDTKPLFERFSFSDARFVIQLNMYRWLLDVFEEDCDMYVMQIRNGKVICTQCPVIKNRDIELMLEFYKKIHKR